MIDGVIKIGEGVLKLPNGEIVKVPKRYCDKRKVEKYIRDKMKALNKKKPNKIGIKIELLIPIRVDDKTLYQVRESRCYKDKWLDIIGGKDKMDEYINNIKNNVIKVCLV